MKTLLSWFNKLGSNGLSTAKAIGLSAAVGVAGVGAWQFLAPGAADSNTAYNAPFAQQEVVYVAGGGGAGAYGANGEVQSSFLASPSKAIEMQQRESARMGSTPQTAQDIASNPNSQGPNIPGAYQMSSSEGLGMGANKAGAEQMLSDMGAGNAGMPDISGMLAQAQGQAQGQASAQAAAGQAGGLKTASLKDGSAAKAGMARAQGNVFDSAYVQQADGFGNASGSAGAAGREGTTLSGGIDRRAPSSLAAGGTADPRQRGGFNSAGNSKDGSVAQGTRSGAGRDLADIAKQSIDITKNKNRASNEGSRPFLASSQQSGGITMADGSTATTGGSSQSSDFGSSSKIKGAQSLTEAGTDIMDQQLQRQQDMANIKSWLWAAVSLTLISSILVFVLSKIPIWGQIAAAFVMVATLVVLAVGFVLAAIYEAKYGTGGWAIGAMVSTGVMMAGVAASMFVPASAVMFMPIISVLGMAGGLHALFTEDKGDIKPEEAKDPEEKPTTPPTPNSTPGGSN